MQAKGDSETLKTTLAAKADLEQQMEKMKGEVVASDSTLKAERDEAIAAKTTLETALSKMGQDLAMERIRLEEIENERDMATIEKETLQRKMDALVGEETSGR